MRGTKSTFPDTYIAAARSVLFAALVGAFLASGACDRTRGEAGIAPPPSSDAAAPAIKQNRHTSIGDATLDVELTLDRAEMTVAQRLNAALEVATRLDATPTLPTIGPTLGEFIVVSSDKHERLDGPIRRTTMRLVLEPFLAGDKAVPAMDIRAVDGGRKLALRTEPVVVKVSAIAKADESDQTPLEPARGPVALIAPSAARSMLMVWIAGAAVLLTAGAGAGLIAAQRRRARRNADPNLRFRQSLARIAGNLESTTSRSDAVHAASELWSALATFLHDELGVPAESHTAAEMAAQLERTSLPASAQSTTLTGIASDLERARFSPDGATVPLMRGLVERARDWHNALPTGLGAVEQEGRP